MLFEYKKKNNFQKRYALNLKLEYLIRKRLKVLSKKISENNKTDRFNTRSYAKNLIFLLHG